MHETSGMQVGDYIQQRWKHLLRFDGQQGARGNHLGQIFLRLHYQINKRVLPICIVGVKHAE